MKEAYVESCHASTLHSLQALSFHSDYKIGIFNDYLPARPIAED
jgi:hypothetical protein